LLSKGEIILKNSSDFIGSALGTSEANTRGILAQAQGLGPWAEKDASALLLRSGLPPQRCAQALALAELLRRALHRTLVREPAFEAPSRVRQFVQLQLQSRPHEVFALMYLDAQNRLIRWEELFRGTLTQTTVYPREVVRRALEEHAAAVILVPNHPSGVAEPSLADEHLTRQLQEALRLVDIRVLDHLVVVPGQVTSFAERGLL
jgi:DNA repair protein RadC